MEKSDSGEKWKNIYLEFKLTIANDLPSSYKIIDQDTLFNLDSTEFPFLDRKKKTREEKEEERMSRRLRRKQAKLGMERPRTPDSDECCQTNCGLDCVMVIHNDKLMDFEEQLALVSSSSSEDDDN